MTLFLQEERASTATKLLHVLDVFALKYVKSGEIDCGSASKSV